MDSSWRKVGAKLHRTDQGLRRMVEGYEWDARELNARYRELETARARGKCTAEEYASTKQTYDLYKASLLHIRKALRALTIPSAKSSTADAPERRPRAITSQSCAKTAAN